MRRYFVDDFIFLTELKFASSVTTIQAFRNKLQTYSTGRKEYTMLPLSEIEPYIAGMSFFKNYEKHTIDRNLEIYK